MKAPAPIIAMRRRTRTDGTPYMQAVLAEDITLRAGTVLHLVRIAADGAAESTHALRVFPPSRAPSARERESAQRLRLDGSAVRIDPRDSAQDAPRAPFGRDADNRSPDAEIVQEAQP